MASIRSKKHIPNTIDNGVVDKPAQFVAAESNPDYFDILRYREKGYNTTLVVSPRNVGKTTSILARAYEICSKQTFIGYDPISNQMKKKNKEFLFIRRSDMELDDFLVKHKEQIAAAGMKLIGRVVYDENGAIIGRFGYLSGASNLKSSDFSHCCLLIFDEFIPENERMNYIKGEFRRFVNLMITCERFKDGKNASDGVGFEVWMTSNRNSDNNIYFQNLDLWFTKELKNIKIPDPTGKFGINAYSLREEDFPCLKKETSSKFWAQFDESVYGVAYTGDNTLDSYRHLVGNPKKVQHTIIARYIINEFDILLTNGSDGNAWLITNYLKINAQPYTLYLRDSLLYGNPAQLKTISTIANQWKYLLQNSSLKFNNYDLVELTIKFIEGVVGKLDNWEKGV